MKKLLLLAIISLSFAIVSKAQFGAKLGMNYAKQTDSEITGMDEVFLGNFQGGVFMDKDVIPLLKIRFGLNYSPKGTKYEIDDDTYNQTTLNYLEIPVLAKVKLGPLYALGGVYGAFALNGKNEGSVLGISASSDVDFDTSDLSKLDYGMMFGLGVQIGLGPLHVFAQGEYSLGLKNIYTGDLDINVKNKVIGVSVGVLIGM